MKLIHPERLRPDNIQLHTYVGATEESTPIQISLKTCYWPPTLGRRWKTKIGEDQAEQQEV